MAETEGTTGQMAVVSDSRSTPGEPPRADQPWDQLSAVLKFAITAILALAATVGCSGRVEVESSKWPPLRRHRHRMPRLVRRPGPLSR